MTSLNYFELKEFKGLYLEDSFVLHIIETPKLISFQMEFVLTIEHPKYKAPLKNEMFCYHYGAINFIEPMQIVWKVRNLKAVSIDANGEYDYGNIDVFQKLEDEFLLEGDWGSLLIKCSDLEVKL